MVSNVSPLCIIFVGIVMLSPSQKMFSAAAITAGIYVWRRPAYNYILFSEFLSFSSGFPILPV
jgi:hypothetical protein